MTLSSIGSYAVGGYQPPNPSKILTKLYDQLEAAGTASAGDTTETSTSVSTATGQTTGASVGQLSDSIMSLLFHIQMQEQSGGTPPQPPSDNENNPKKAISEFFASIDSDGDGNVSSTELGIYLKAQGGSDADAAKVFSALDSDGSGSVSENELRQAVERGHHQRAEHRPPPSAADLADKLFDEADADGNGTLTKTELEDFVTSKGGTATQADAAYTALDTNGTGSVTKEQLVAATESLKALNKPEAPPSEPPSETSRARADLAPWLQFVDALATATKSTSSVAVAA